MIETSKWNCGAPAFAHWMIGSTGGVTTPAKPSAALAGDDVSMIPRWSARSGLQRGPRTEHGARLSEPPRYIDRSPTLLRLALAEPQVTEVPDVIGYELDWSHRAGDSELAGEPVQEPGGSDAKPAQGVVLDRHHAGSRTEVCVPPCVSIPS